MPKLIVYVKASTWQRVVDQAGEDAAVLARALSVEAIEQFVMGLSERGDGGPGVDRVGKEPPKVEPPSPARSESPIVTASTKDRRPTPAECGMSNRHGTRSKSNPCPRCGYPL